MPSIVNNDPWWFADPHLAAYTKQALLEPTVPPNWAFNPGYAQIQTEYVWSQGWMDVIQGGMTQEAATEKSFTRAAEILTKYPIAQA
jgi:ABC-type glycerol-3-phosphate transport system substrate-binding protein